MTRRRSLAALLASAALAACSPGDPAARPSASGPASTPPASPTASAPVSPAPSPTPSPSPPDPGPPWPRASRGAPPPAFGAVVTTRRAQLRGGGTLAAGLTLPRLGGTPNAPRVLTPCGRRVDVLPGSTRYLPPSPGQRLPASRPQEVTIVVDPGHGGPQLGAVSPQGHREKDRNLQIAREVRTALRGRVGRVVLTRDADFEATLEFRVALADALRADAAVSVHLNSSPDGPRPTPGVETYGSIADPQGRRFAGVMYEHQRRYLDTLGGPWVGDRDAGAKYRTGRDGRDYYGLLRRAHRPWTISESLFISSRREAALVAQPAVRRELGRVIADALVAFTTTRAAGSGWVKPYPRPADPGTGDGRPCVDPR